jgi:hypothetical protein
MRLRRNHVVQTFMRLLKDTWQQIKAGYAGIGLGNRAQHECPGRDCACSGQARRLDTADCSSKTGRCHTAIKCNHAIAINRGGDARARRTLERYRERVAGVSERVVGHVESMDPDEILNRSAQFEKIDTIARRTFGLNEAPSNQGSLTLSVLTNHAVVQVNAQGAPGLTNLDEEQ